MLTSAYPGQAARQHQAAWRRLPVLEYVLVLVLCLLVLALHDVRYLLTQPYWNDEAWVAVTTRFPLAQLPATTSSMPIGWAFLLRLVTFGRGESGRLLPLAFAALAVVPGYWLARRLDWKDQGAAVLAGLLAAGAVLLVPAMLVRDDLKQYTADACISLVILAVTSRIERRWSQRGLALLSLCVWGGMLLSHTAAFVGAAAFAALGLLQLVRRAWRRLVEATISAAITAGLAAAVYEAFDARAVVPDLTRYWQASFVPRHGGLRALITFVVHHFDRVHLYFGLGPAWLAVPLWLAGLVTIARLGRPATAIAIAMLWPLMLVLAELQKYPFLNLRTSTFMITLTAVTAAIGVGGICVQVRALLPQRLIATAAAVLVGCAAVAGFALAAAPYVRSDPIPVEPIRQQAQYVAAHATASEPVVVSADSNWGFAYYWPTGQPSRRHNPFNLHGYQAYFAGQPRIIIARDGYEAGIKAALERALRQVRPGSCTTIWLVRPRINALEQAAWTRVLGQLGLTPAPLPDGMSYLRTGPRSCR